MQKVSCWAVRQFESYQRVEEAQMIDGQIILLLAVGRRSRLQTLLFAKLTQFLNGEIAVDWAEPLRD
jgi:hypothetical protein